MQISKVATAVALSTGLLFGCNSDGLPIPTGSGDGSTTDPSLPTSALLNGYWEFSDTSAFSATYSTSSSADLPNVYRFSADGETLYYYTDNSADATLGEYERFETTYEETIEDETSGQVAFTLFNNDGTVGTVSVDGDYSAADGGLAISGNIPVSGTDHRDDTSVTGPAEEADGEPAVVTDNFDTYEVGLQIDVANTDYTALNVDGSTNIANISNTVASSGENSLFLHDNSTESKPIVSRTFVDGIAESGSLSTSVYVPSDTNKSTYLYLGISEDASTDARFADLYFGSSKLTFRGQNGDKINLASYSRDTWVDVDMAWSPNDDDTYGVTVTIDGVEWPALLTANAIPGAPTLFAMYVGDNGSLGTSSYFDNLDSKLFEAQVEEPDPTDNFDSYTVGTQIDVANPAYKTKNVAGDKLTSAIVSNDFSKSGSNSLRLEDKDPNTKPAVGLEFADGAATTGSVSTSVYIPSEGYDSATYVFLGSNSDGSSGGRYTEVVFTSSMIKFRNETGSQVDLASYSKDAWVDLTISWEGTDITVNVDGTDYTGLKAQNSLDPDKETPTPTALTLYVGDNSSVATYSYFDNLDSDLF